MKDHRIVVNPFRMISPKLDSEALRLEEFHEKPFSETVALQEGLLIMVSKAIEMTRLLSKAVVSGSQAQMNKCEALAKDVHEQEKVLTKNLLSSEVKTVRLSDLIRFPYRLERVGDLLESILRCCRVKARDGIPFGDKAHAELDQLLALLVDMLVNLRDAFVTTNRFLVARILTDGQNLSQALQDVRLAHWERLERGFGAPQASSLFLDILDSITGINEYIAKMCDRLVVLAEAMEEEEAAR
jgi:Na+/phosphate symporter